MKIHEEFTETITFGTLSFVVNGCRRDWNPLPQHTPPSETVWEAFTYLDDKKIVGAGLTKKDAIGTLYISLGVEIALSLKTKNK